MDRLQVMALVNRQHEYIFIHIYKTAGNSIREVLPGGTEIAGVHAPASWIEDIFDRRQWAHFFKKWTKFGVVRNPFDWIVSLKHYIAINPTNWAFAETKGMNMNQFLRWHERTEKTREPFANGHQLGTLSKFLCDENGKPIVDVVLRQEHLDQGFKQLSKRLGIPHKTLPRKNPTASRKWRDHRSYFDAESRGLVERIFAEDLERFNYTW